MIEASDVFPAEWEAAVELADKRLGLDKPVQTAGHVLLPAIPPTELTAA